MQNYWKRNKVSHISNFHNSKVIVQYYNIARENSIEYEDGFSKLYFGL